MAIGDPYPYSNGPHTWAMQPPSGIMTLRDYFAAQALAGILARVDGMPNWVAIDAYKAADAMLKERGGG